MAMSVLLADDGQQNLDFLSLLLLLFLPSSTMSSPSAATVARLETCLGQLKDIFHRLFPELMALEVIELHLENLATDRTKLRDHEVRSPDRSCL